MVCVSGGRAGCSRGVTAAEANEKTVTVPKLSAPEKHSLVLMCAEASDVDWSHGLRGVIASKHGQQVSYLDQRKHQLLSDGALHIRDLQPSDAGQYYCNHQLIADIAVLKGQNFTIPAGTTVYLPCKTSDKFKQRWAFKRTAQARKEFISTLYKNSTVKKERDDPTSRFTHTISHLIISDLQLQDSGLYLCNNREMAVLTVTTVTVSVLLALCLLSIVCVCVLSVILSCRRSRTNTRKESGRGAVRVSGCSALQRRRRADEQQTERHLLHTSHTPQEFIRTTRSL
ncbi:hypothetical protein DPX16_5503 [Anabarilius grahami]|uniref:Ig-like domain-containing protein n=1 Tax=Anabarilius grahami TaxID=495550 RepID=A0A3N0Z3V0_ANAGA|nr:hypothetical protein DPX16_5503 [Anabarilius grahami]